MSAQTAKDRLRWAVSYDRLGAFVAGFGMRRINWRALIRGEDHE